tara:strand:+ start:388 stop:531 length:144 start_codon:yes stop_codon:yes gene_type:complete
MVKVKKKPLLVKFTENEHEHLYLKANEKGITMTAYVRELVNVSMKKK